MDSDDDNVHGMLDRQEFEALGKYCSLLRAALQLAWHFSMSHTCRSCLTMAP